MYLRKAMKGVFSRMFFNKLEHGHAYVMFPQNFSSFCSSCILCEMCWVIGNGSFLLSFRLNAVREICARCPLAMKCAW